MRLFGVTVSQMREDVKAAAPDAAHAILMGAWVVSLALILCPGAIPGAFAAGGRRLRDAFLGRGRRP